jgi:hypothetical protein
MMTLRSTRNKSARATSAVTIRQQVHALKDAAYSVNFFACHSAHHHHKKHPGTHLEQVGL